MSSLIDKITTWVEWAGVLIIFLGSILAVIRTVVRFGTREGQKYQRFRQDLGKAILLGLEFLVAADIIQTVAVDPSLENVGVLGIIVVIRTFLSMALEVEIEGTLPWRRSLQKS